MVVLACGILKLGLQKKVSQNEALLAAFFSGLSRGKLPRLRPEKSGFAKTHFMKLFFVKPHFKMVLKPSWKLPAT